jgi:short chain dehydrogenase
MGTGRALVGNMSSISGKSGQPWLSVYSATKAAVVGFTQAMHKELGTQGIKSTALCPAFVDTAMTDFVKGQVDPADMIQVSDIAETVRVLLKMSPGCVVPEIVDVGRVGLRPRAREPECREPTAFGQESVDLELAVADGADDLPAVVDPRGLRVLGFGDVDGHEAPVAVAQEPVRAVGGAVGAHDPAAVVHADGDGLADGTGSVERRDATALVAQIAAYPVVVVADETAAVVDVVDAGVPADGPRHVDGGERAAVQDEPAERAAAAALHARDLPTVVDAEDLGVVGAGHVDRGDRPVELAHEAVECRHGVE